MHRRLLAVLSAAVVALTTLAVASPAGSTVFSESEVAGWSTNGSVYAVDVVGDVVYLGGSFTQMVPPDGGGRVDRVNVAAISRTTGQILDFRADTDGIVLAVESDGARVWLGGNFDTVNGEADADLAAVDASTGARDAAFAGDPNGTVRALELDGGRLWVGGSFGRMNGDRVGRVASLDPVTGQNDSGFAPRADGPVKALDLSPDGSFLIVGGGFNNVGGAARRSLALLDPATGAAVGPAFPANLSPVLAVAVNDDGSRVFAGFGGSQGGALYGWNNRVASFNPATGANHWWRRPSGDTQALGYHDGFLYFGFHDPFEGDATVRMLRISDAGVLDDNFRPEIDSRRGVLAIDVNADALVAGGKFRHVNGTDLRGIAVFPYTLSSTTLVSAGSTWRFTADPQADGAWAQLGFDAATWGVGPAQLGFGDGDEATVVPAGSTTYYFRQTFQAGGPAPELDLSLVRDDGAVVYLNGVEVARTNMPAGPVTSSTEASTALGSGENNWNGFTVSGAALQAGTNVLAVEVHQANATSSDVSFDAVLNVTGDGGVANPDTVAPTSPTGVDVFRVTSSVVRMRWNDDSTDDRGMGGYRVYRDDELVTDLRAGRDTVIRDTDVTSGATHLYAVVAYDTSGNESAPNSVEVTIP